MKIKCGACCLLMMTSIQAEAVVDFRLGIHPTTNEVAFATLPQAHKEDLVRLAKCAAAAYPDAEIPSDYKGFDQEDWNASLLGKHYAKCSCGTDGLLNAGSGLRARFMKHKRTGDLVIAWSGCDIVRILDSPREALADVSTFLGFRFGITKNQFEEALAIFNRVLIANPLVGIEVVGHSLGGGITAYVLAMADVRTRKIRGVSFNGIGMPSFVDSKQLGKTGAFLLSTCMENVKVDCDIVYVSPKWSVLRKLMAVNTYYGPLYIVDYKKHMAKTGNGLMDALNAHDKAVLIELMEREME